MKRKLGGAFVRAVGATFAVAAIALCATQAAVAAEPITEHFNVCAPYGDVRICSGSVPSFDGSKLDVDLTLPMHGTGTCHPLVVMLHGFGLKQARVGVND